MKSIILLSILLCSFCCQTALTYGNNAPAQAKHPADKVKATKVVKGIFVGFEQGDYLHALIKKPKGKTESYFLGNKPGIEYFLALHKGQSMEITYQVVDSYIPENGGVMTIERLIAAKTNDDTYAEWWKKERAASTMKQIDRKYARLVQNSIVKQ